MKIDCFKAFSDNYIWFIQSNKHIVVIDPGESEAIIHYLHNNQFNLKAILLTHDHHDHVGGLENLLNHAKVPVYGHCRFADHDNDYFSLGNGITCKILKTPGHTDKSVCFLITHQENQHLFCGDTLFASGCGRVFTRDYAAMYNSLNQLKALNPDCLIYPGHEYTLKNIQFAQYIEPENKAINERFKAALELWRIQQNTLPNTIGIEQETNLFFRCDNPLLIQALSKKIGHKVEAGLDCFIQLRQLKDIF